MTNADCKDPGRVRPLVDLAHRRESVGPGWPEGKLYWPGRL